MHKLSAEPGLERLFWLIFERSSNPIALLDERRRITELNDAAADMLGRERSQLVGRPITDSIQISERAAAEDGWERLLRTGEAVGTGVLLRADGSPTDVEFAARLAVIDGRRVAVYVTLPRTAPAGLHPPGAAPAGTSLTKREREVITLIALGDDTAEIARQLHISPETVRTHVRNSMVKLHAHTRAQLVAIVLCSEASLDPVGDRRGADRLI